MIIILIICVETSLSVECDAYDRIEPLEFVGIIRLKNDAKVWCHKLILF